MDALVQFGLTNAVAATALAVVVAVLAKLWTRPAARHALWLVVLVKLLAPPLIVLPIVWPREPEAVVSPPTETVAVELQRPLDPPAEFLEPLPERNDDPIAQPEPTPASLPLEADVSPALAAVEIVPAIVPETSTPLEWTTLLGIIWIAGSALWFAVALMRIRRFQALLGSAKSAPSAVQEQAALLARHLGLADCPEVWLTPGALSPLLWSIGGSAKILVPAGLLERLDAVQLQALLLHELAHYRRRDHWTRRLELLVMCLYWWLPTAWYARRCLRDAEEECCDAWVVWALPEAKKSYASALVETWDFLSHSALVLPPAATGAVQLNLLRRRLTMIMRGTTPRNLGMFGVPAAVTIAILFLPLWPTVAQQQIEGGQTENSQPPASKRANPEEAKKDASTQLERAKRAVAEAAFAVKSTEESLKRWQELWDKIKAPVIERSMEQAEQRLQQETDALWAAEKRYFELKLKSRDLEQKAVEEALAKEAAKLPLKATPTPLLPGKVVPAPATQADSLERRIAAMEKKLDLILNELRALRKMPSAELEKAAIILHPDLGYIAAVRDLAGGSIPWLDELYEMTAQPQLGDIRPRVTGVKVKSMALPGDPKIVDDASAGKKEAKEGKEGQRLPKSAQLIVVILVARKDSQVVAQLERKINMDRHSFVTKHTFTTQNVSSPNAMEEHRLFIDIAFQAAEK